MNVKDKMLLWKTCFTDCFNCLPVAAFMVKKILCCPGGLSSRFSICGADLENDPLMDQIKAFFVTFCDVTWVKLSQDKNDRGVSFTLGAEVVVKFLCKYDLDLICRAYNMVEDGYEFFAKKHLITLLSAPNYCGEFDNGGTIKCGQSLFHISKLAEKKEAECQEIH